MNKLLFLGLLLLIGCEGEWGGGQVGRVSCSFDEFLPNVGRALKMATGNNGNNLYILDDFSYVYSYKRDNLYECAFNLKNTYRFNGFPKDVLFANNNFYVQDGASLKTKDKELCYAKDGVFAVSGTELAVGNKSGVEIWNISGSNCAKKGSIPSQSALALAATNSEYYVAEAGSFANEPLNLAMYSKNWEQIHLEPMSSIPGNEKNFCSADRIAANDYGVYLLDKKCRKIGVFDNYAVWRKTISLDSLGIRNPLDIGTGEYSYIFIMHSNGVERVNAF
ncbi:MAG: hypothetical protein LBC87_05685 [Fibromonadaceae bacterium]|nr:hypothetical protein [Fibromonadaceae bacterium]